MIKNYCDMCGNEIEGTVWQMSIKPKSNMFLGDIFNAERDLCEICRNKVREFIGENSVQRCKVEIENRKEVRECACGARFSAFVADKTDVMCAKCKHERGETANEDIE